MELSWNVLEYPKLQAKLPSMSMSSYETDTSLAINNMALKYLTDAELTKLAAMHQNREKKDQIVKPNDLSMASKQFLAKYGLQNNNEQDNNGHTRPQEIMHQNQIINDGQRTAPLLLPKKVPGVSVPVTATKQPASTIDNRTPNPAPVFPETTPRPIQAPQLGPASSLAPGVKQFDRVLDISAIRQQSTLL